MVALSAAGPDASTTAASARAFYRDVLAHLLAEGVLARDQHLLVACGASLDREVLAELGFEHVTLANLDERLPTDAFAPYALRREDVERLSFGPDAFDFAIVHEGLHHCHSPHRALAELYRVARSGVLFFEPYDNLLTRVAVRLGFGQDYERAAVYYNDCGHGGVANGPVPNFVYRWTEREVRKAVQSLAPHGPPEFRFFHGTVYPWAQLRGLRNPLYYWGLYALRPALALFSRLFPRQGNQFAALIRKPAAFHPWVERRDGRIGANRAWLERAYQG